MKRAAVFLQRLGHRAGAQACLLRLLRQPEMRALEPVVVTGEDAWLSRQCARDGIACLVERYPSSRSVAGRLFRNAAFAARVKKRLQDRRVSVVHGNDHLESLLALALGQALGAPTALFLRSIAMGEADFLKYRCGGHALLAAAGAELQRRARSWAGGREVLLLHDGLEPGDFLPPRLPGAAFPAEILVIGSPLALKGWTDVAEAFRLLEGEAAFPRVRLSFTGEDPGLPRLEKTAFAFIGRVDGFRDLARGFGLALNASRQESFGVAALEVLAAGVPLLSTRVGVIEQVLAEERCLARPGNPRELADRLLALARGWPAAAPDLAAVQARIREKFMAALAARNLLAAYAAGGIT